MRYALYLLLLGPLVGCGHPEGAHVFGRDARFSVKFAGKPECRTRPIKFRIIPAIEEVCRLEDASMHFREVEVWGFQDEDDSKSGAQIADIVASFNADYRHAAILQKTELEVYRFGAVDVTLQPEGRTEVDFVRYIVAGRDVVIISGGSYESETRPADVTAFMDSLTIAH